MFLCDRMGRYQLNEDRRPVLVGLAVNLGGTQVGDNTVCTPMIPENLAFISEKAGCDVACDNQYTRDNLMKAKAKFARTAGSVGVDDAQMKEQVDCPIQ